MSLALESRPVIGTSDLATSPARVVNRVQTSIVIPAFELDPIIDWMLSSYIPINFLVTLPRPASLVYPVNPPAGNVSFILAVSWLDSASEIQRRLFWTQGSERLHYPLYAGERLPVSFTLEIWSVEDYSLVQLEHPLTILTSLSRGFTDYTSTGDDVVSPTEYIIPFPINVL